MKKIIKKIGNSLGIIFDREDCNIYELKVGDVIDLDDILVLKTRKIKLKGGQKNTNAK